MERGVGVKIGLSSLDATCDISRLIIIIIRTNKSKAHRNYI